MLHITSHTIFTMRSGNAFLSWNYTLFVHQPNRKYFELMKCHWINKTSRCLLLYRCLDVCGDTTTSRNLKRQFWNCATHPLLAADTAARRRTSPGGWRTTHDTELYRKNNICRCRPCHSALVVCRFFVRWSHFVRDYFHFILLPSRSYRFE